MTHDIDTFPHERIRILNKAAFDEFNHVNSIKYSDFPHKSELNIIDNIIPFIQPESRAGECYANVLNLCMKSHAFGIAFCYVRMGDVISPHCIAYMDGLFYEASPRILGKQDPTYLLYLKLTWDDYQSLYKKMSLPTPRDGEKFRPFSLDEKGNLVAEG